MTDLRYLLANAVSAMFMPLLVAQGYYVRRVTPRLPGADGPTRGSTGSGAPAIRLLVIGESTVAGVGASSHDTALTGQLARALSLHLGREVIWQAIGLNGVTAAKTCVQLVPTIPADPVDVAVVALGVNDVISLNAPSRWRSDLDRLVVEIRDRVGPVPVVLAAMPPMGQFPAFPQPLRAALGARSAALGRAAMALARELERVTLCVNTLENDPCHYCEDRFHPSESGYRAWGSRMAVDVAKVVGGGPPD